MVYDYYYCLHTVFFTVQMVLCVILRIFLVFGFLFGCCCWVCAMCVCTIQLPYVCTMYTPKWKSFDFTMRMNACEEVPQSTQPFICRNTYTTSPPLPHLLLTGGAIGRTVKKNYYYALQNYRKYLPNVNNAKDYFRVFVYAHRIHPLSQLLSPLPQWKLLSDYLFLLLAAINIYMWYAIYSNTLKEFIERHAGDAEHLMCFSL